MRTGKISESVLKRSVLSQINIDEKMEGGTFGKSLLYSIKGAGIGEDCAFLSYQGEAFEGSAELAVSVQTVALPVKNAAYYAVMAAANNLAAGTAKPQAAFLSVLLPGEAEEELLKDIMSQANRCCRQLGMQIAGGHTEVSPSVRNPVITVTALGERQSRLSSENGAAGMDIVASKWIAMEGTALMAIEKEAVLGARYSPRFIKEAQRLEESLSVAQEAAIALESDVYTMHDVRNGGIFAALWEISRRIGVGLTIDLKKIPVKQETVEICEFFDLNPYQLLSGGMLLMVTKRGEALTEALARAGIPAAVIGTTNGSNDKIVTNSGETRYLEPPAADEIFKLFY